MHFIKLVAAIMAAAVLAGCANPPLTINYAPSSTMSVAGEMEVGTFVYLPGKNNKKVKPNQIRNTAMGSILFEKNINEYFETALFTEGRFVGISMNQAEQTVSGSIIEFLIDDLGYSIDWTLEVNYVIQSKSTGNECYSKVHKLEKNTAKFGDVFGTLNEVIKLNIEMAFADPEFVACINA